MSDGTVRGLLVADVALDSRAAGADSVYTYRAEPDSRPGQTVVVPVGPRTSLGVVIDVRRVLPEHLGFAERLLKPIGATVRGMELPEASVDLARYVARRTLSTLPVAISSAIPPGMRERLTTTWRLIEAQASSDHSRLSAVQQEALRTLTDEGGILVESKSKPLPPGMRKVLRMLVSLGLAEETVGVETALEKQLLAGSYRLTSDESAVEGFLRKQGKKKPAQALLVIGLQQAGDASFSSQELKALAGATDQTVRALLATGLLLETDAAEAPSRPPPTANPHQAEAIEAVSAAIADTVHKVFLLYGVTGSGKTEVYLRCASEALKRGKQVLYLVPEIALTAQVVAQLRERFGKRVAVLHSNLSQQERLRNWVRVAEGDAPVVLGPRSALFAPFRNLGLIVVDEEHESSYKQESSPRYHARDAARFLAERFSAPLILGSATPSIESYFEATQGTIELLRLPERAASARLPSVHVVDLTEGYRLGRPELISAPLREKIDAALGRGEQAILFLNRRAFSPFLLCRECGRRFNCPNCTVTLAYHKKEAQLRCHHCGYSRAAPDVCPDCGGLKVAPFGAGAERIEEVVREEFAGATVARLDRDVARTKGALETTLAAFRSGATDILVGTQMVAKGLDFPNVTVVGVIAADLSLNIPDFRSAERTFQLLSQVAGRAGRGSAHGEVVIQTLSPDHIAVACAQSHDYETLYSELILEREEALYPPFCQIVNVVLTSENRASVVRASSQVRQALAAVLDLPVQGSPERLPVLLGPVDCPFERLHGAWRRHIVAKLPCEMSLEPFGRALDGCRFRDVQVVADVDPTSMM